MKVNKAVLVRSSGRHRIFILGIVTATLLSGFLSAQTDTWMGGSGQWRATTNWSLNQVPSPSNDCDIPAGSTPTIDHGN